MQETQNTTLVQNAYGAFGRGDIAALLAVIDEQVEWQAVVGLAPHVPTNGLHRGKAAVGKFFQTVGETLTFHRFEPREFVAQGDKVIVLGHYNATVKSTGRTVDSEWVMVFTLRDGKVTRFVEFSDSAQLNAAFA